MSRTAIIWILVAGLALLIFFFVGLPWIQKRKLINEIMATKADESALKNPDAARKKLEGLHIDTLKAILSGKVR